MSDDPRRLVKDLADLKAIIKDLGGKGEFYIMLSGGQFRSSKTIKRDSVTGSWWVYNHIDDMEQSFDGDAELLDPEASHIGVALDRNAFVWRGL